MAVIEVEGLRKEYRRLRGGKTIAVAGLDMVVPEGGVFGFLGPNGSGKTTTIRCLLGLVRANAGRTRLLGAEPHRLHTVVGRVGSIVETPVFFPTMSGRRNLMLLGRVHRLGRKRVDDVLDRAGLLARGGDIVKHYSLGMKQRLGIAAALLKDPEVLILDEPSNGLDPAGIKEVRDLIRSLGAEGRTVFVSSHLLGEVQQMCDRVAILSRGRCIAAGPVADVLAHGRAAEVLARVDDPEAGLRALQDAGFEATLDAGRLRVAVPPEDAAKVSRTLGARDLWVSELRADEVDLETVFLELTREEPQP